MKSRSDVEADPDKKQPWDFFLWAVNSRHIMKWPSPWGEGYPGWHIECTAMSVKYLGENFDIHTGGIEHIAVHHTNEIAQGFAAFGKQTANYWLHNAHLLGEGGVKMSKSLGNFVTAQELSENGYDPLALRYLFLNSHYKKGLSFSFDALKGAESALNNLRARISSLRSEKDRTALSGEKQKKTEGYASQFNEALADDLNVPQALAVLWEMLKSNIPSTDKYDLAMSFDEVLGLKLSEGIKKEEMPDEIKKLMADREKLRANKKFDEADKIRKQIEDAGFEVKDTSI